MKILKVWLFFGVILLIIIPTNLEAKEIQTNQIKRSFSRFTGVYNHLGIFTESIQNYSYSFTTQGNFTLHADLKNNASVFYPDMSLLLFFPNGSLIERSVGRGILGQSWLFVTIKRGEIGDYKLLANVSGSNYLFPLAFNLTIEVNLGMTVLLSSTNMTIGNREPLDFSVTVFDPENTSIFFIGHWAQIGGTNDHIRDHNYEKINQTTFNFHWSSGRFDVGKYEFYLEFWDKPVGGAENNEWEEIIYVEITEGYASTTQLAILPIVAALLLLFWFKIRKK